MIAEALHLQAADFFADEEGVRQTCKALGRRLFNEHHTTVGTECIHRSAQHSTAADGESERTASGECSEDSGASEPVDTADRVCNAPGS
jgi:hypothetical protein